MSTEKIRSPASLCKIAIVVLGVIIMGVGLHSHFESLWKKGNWYQLCDVPGITDCPDISLERYFVAMVIITFLLSLVALIAVILVDTSSGVFKMVDMGYHGIAAVLLMIAAIVYLVSAGQIKKGVGDVAHKQLKFLGTEKVAAGVLTIFQSILYGVATLFIARQ